jgi:hypothetical protein
MRNNPIAEPAADGGESRRCFWLALALVVGILGALWLADKLDNRVYWDGSKEVAMRFVIVDAESGAPVPDAVVQVGVDGLPASWREARTGTDGAARLIVRCWAAGSDTLLRRTASVSCTGVDIHVSKEGYKDVWPTSLWVHARWLLSYDQLPPPPVRLPLQKKAQEDKAKGPGDPRAGAVPVWDLPAVVAEKDRKDQKDPKDSKDKTSCRLA